MAANIPNQFVSIQHFGILDGDKEILEGTQVEEWSGGFENYSFEEKGDITRVIVALDVMVDHMDFFLTTYPNALKKLRDMVEVG